MRPRPRASWDAGTAPEKYPGSVCTVPSDTSVSLFTVLQHDDVGALSHSRLLTAVAGKPGSNVDVHPFLSILFVFPGPPEHSKVEDAAGHRGT